MSGLTSAFALSSGRTVMVDTGFCTSAAAEAAAFKALQRPAAHRNMPVTSFKRTRSRVMDCEPTESRFACRYLTRMRGTVRPAERLGMLRGLTDVLHFQTAEILCARRRPDCARDQR